MSGPRARAGDLAALILGAVLLLAPLGGAAQETPTRQVDETGALMPRTGTQTGTALVEADAPPGPVNGRAPTEEDRGAATTLDYSAWEQMAARAETAITDPNSTEVSLEHLRAQLVDWREALQGAQSANSARIATLRTQIAALGCLARQSSAALNRSIYPLSGRPSHATYQTTCLAPRWLAR